MIRWALVVDIRRIYPFKIIKNEFRHDLEDDGKIDTTIRREKVLEIFIFNMKFNLA